MLELIKDFFIGISPTMGENTALLLSRVVLLALTAAGAYLAYGVLGRLLKQITSRLVAKTKTRWDDILFESGFFDSLSLFFPALIVHFASPAIFAGYSGAVVFMKTAVSIYVVIVSLAALYCLLNWVVELYHSIDCEEKMPIRSFAQGFKIIGFLVAAIIILSLLLDKNPLGLLSGLGALTAILMLVFKDSILGFVAGIQMNVNNMVRIGDWVEMSKYGADGDVIDVSLTTVKVQNWDKTITTIPAYSMISDSFKNWRGMSQSGGRRIKRCVNIDIMSIKFCDEQMLDKFRKIRYISDYIDSKQKEITAANPADAEYPEINCRRLTNIGTFRAYLAAYLRNHYMINQQMTFLIRHLQPGETGLPIEIYVFSKDKVWANYEALQADIFDHILAVIPEFDLRVFQSPSGYDLRQIACNQKTNSNLL